MEIGLKISLPSLKVGILISMDVNVFSLHFFFVFFVFFPIQSIIEVGFGMLYRFQFDIFSVNTIPPLFIRHFKINQGSR